jgi:hypothetical protein
MVGDKQKDEGKDRLKKADGRGIGKTKASHGYIVSIDVDDRTAGGVKGIPQHQYLIKIRIKPRKNVEKP